jgi:hypothetical protein
MRSPASGDGPFSRRALVWLVGVGACSLALALALLVAGAPESAEVDSAGADAFSRSALGHRAFVRLLRRAGVPVMVSRFDSARRAGRQAVLVVAEPHLENAHSVRARRLAEMLGSVQTALLVLPKWTGREDARRPGFLATAVPLPEATVGHVLSAASLAATVARRPGVGASPCAGLAAPVTLTSPQLLTPTTESLKPVVSCDGGVLLGVVEVNGLRLFVLSDPDLLANHGLAKGENQRAALEIVETVREARMALVVDETLHGHQRIPSLWRELFTFPLLPAALQAGLSLLVLVLSGLGRFGAPLPAGLSLAPGKSVLIENTAFLLRSAGHSAHTVGRYFDAALAEVARALHAPEGAKAKELREFLHGAARRRKTSVDLRTLEAQVERVKRQEVPPAAIVAAARRVHRFREEMLRGPHDHPGR